MLLRMSPQNLLIAVIGATGTGKSQVQNFAYLDIANILES